MKNISKLFSRMSVSQWAVGVVIGLVFAGGITYATVTISNWANGTPSECPNCGTDNITNGAVISDVNIKANFEYLKSHMADIDRRLTILETPIVPVAPMTIEWTVPGTYTWTVPGGVTSVNVRLSGGGGGGGGGGNDNTGASGGRGGNGCLLTRTLAVNPAEIYRLTVGGGGKGGGHSTVLGHCILPTGGANGGENGEIAAMGGCGGGGGGASSFNTLIAGGGGGGGGGGYVTNGVLTSGGNGGNGSNIALGGAGSTNNGSNGSNCDNLNTGTYGRGGSAGGVYPTPGGEGANGAVIISW